MASVTVSPLHGGHDSVADILAAELAVVEAERDQLREELDAKRRENAHLRAELKEEAA